MQPIPHAARNESRTNILDRMLVNLAKCLVIYVKNGTFLLSLQSFIT